MIKANVSQLKNRLSAYLRKVKAGETVVVYDRDRPIARLDRIGVRDAEDERIARLEAAGIISRPERPWSGDALKGELPKPKKSVLEALLEERAEGR
jgi:antitoxin (DNA-binding transcriptional repressor) of toxin-antitoxin stability system